MLRFLCFRKKGGSKNLLEMLSFATKCGLIYEIWYHKMCKKEKIKSCLLTFFSMLILKKKNIPKPSTDREHVDYGQNVELEQAIYPWRRIEGNYLLTVIRTNALCTYSRLLKVTLSAA